MRVAIQVHHNNSTTHPSAPAETALKLNAQTVIRTCPFPDDLYECPHQHVEEKGHTPERLNFRTVWTNIHVSIHMFRHLKEATVDGVGY